MARTLSLSFTSSYNQPNYLNQTNHFKSHKQSLLSQKQTYPFVNFSKSSHYNLILTCSTSQHSSSCSTSSSPTLLSPLQTGTFLSNQDLEKLQFLQDFSYFQELESGSMWVRVMRDDELDMIVGLLAESFVESMVMPKGYVNLLGILVKQYLVERRSLMPHTATLIGFYKGNDDQGEGELAGTVEISFNKKGANASPPSPTPPKDSPYICNMTVKKSLRRRGIGWHLLKASEELICQMSFSRDIYLHCRMIDVAPFNMYTRAGYSVLETDNILILLTLQRRKHLMCKKITVPASYSEMDVPE
ncbi:GCN5-related N-acetyltransferase 5, chloroplastic-like [Apium graveolens]|uniref:GCN5-related N-acetyltransferase 5, chloroplastic-like n=1 Tax=Apium graveolens TaxID=4045 RepID=UPI003D7A345B